MNRKKISLGLLFLAVALVIVPSASAFSSYYTVLQSIYGGPTTCQLDCHTSPSGPPPFTAYGTVFASYTNHSTDTAGVLRAIGPPLATITVTPAAASVTVGGSQTFLASTLDPFGNQIIATITWSSSNTTVGTIDPTTGVFTAVKAGTATITATGGGTGSGTITETATVTVSAPVQAPVLTTITVSPATASLTIGGSQTFTAAGFDQFGASITISPPVVWSSSNTTVGTIDVAGVFTALATGTTTITATNGTGGTVSGTATATVTAAPPTPVLTTITVTPETATLAIGDTQTFSAAGFDQFGAPITISPAVVWNSSDTTVGTIDATTEVFTALAAGTTTITATNGTDGAVSGTATVTVTAVTPPPSTASVTFVVTDSKTGRPLSGAQVSLNGITIKTNRTGKAVFTDIALGTYSFKVSISRDHYSDTVGSIDVAGDMTVQVKLVRAKKD